MPNAVKYSTSSETLALKKGNFYIATGDVDKGTTSNSGYWNGITPPTSGYTIYLNKASNGPSIYVADNDSELISLTNLIAGANYTTKQQCFEYFNGQSDKLVLNKDIEPVVTNGLIYFLDPGITSSYPTSQTNWYSIGQSNYTATLVNSPTFNTSNGGFFTLDGADDYILGNGIEELGYTNNYTISLWLKSVVGGYIFANKTNTGERFGISNPTWTNGVISAFFYNGSFYTTVGQYFQSNEWINVVVVNQSQQLTIYVSLNKSTTLPSGGGPLDPGQNGMNIGKRNRSGPTYFTGNISAIQIYNRVLSESEITQNYEAIGKRFVSLEVQSLVVAGGGSGGGYGYPSGGGGAGGLLTGYTTSLITNTNYTITVGAGGSSNSNGSNSVFNTLTSIGGGRGGNGRSGAGVSGGSGGGGGSNFPSDGNLVNGLTPAGSGTVGQGNDGGVGKSVYGDTRIGGVPTGAGGGGGAGTVGGVGGTGTTSPTLFAGSGGTGLYFSEYTSIGGSPNGWFAGGGGGSTSYNSAATNAVGVGGNGGGGNGSYTQFSSGPTAVAGLANTGGGGGGAGYIEYSSANGGSGIVILRIPDVYKAVFSSGVGYTETVSNGYKYYKVTATSTTSETVYFT
jgi:hypothetical protein